MHDIDYIRSHPGGFDDAMARRGVAPAKTYDLEVWFPGQRAWREVSSCSNCHDFQARRLRALARPARAGERPSFVHTLNGSGVAVGRALAAVFETNQRSDRSVSVPEPLCPFLGGMSVIRPAA